MYIILKVIDFAELKLSNKSQTEKASDDFRKLTLETSSNLFTLKVSKSKLTFSSKIIIIFLFDIIPFKKGNRLHKELRNANLITNFIRIHNKIKSMFY